MTWVERRRIFVCYADADIELVRPVADELTNRGHHLFCAWRDITPGAVIPDKLRAALLDSSHYLLALSPRLIRRYHKRSLVFQEVVSMLTVAPHRIIPIWYELSLGDVKVFNPFLASICAIRSDENTTMQVADYVERAVQEGQLASFPA